MSMPQTAMATTPEFRSRQLRDFVLLVIGATAIGNSSVLVRFAETAPAATAFWRMAFALPILAAWAMIERREPGAVRPPSRVDHREHLRRPVLRLRPDLVERRAQPDDDDELHHPGASRARGRGADRLVLVPREADGRYPGGACHGDRGSGAAGPVGPRRGYAAQRLAWRHRLDRGGLRLCRIHPRHQAGAGLRRRRSHQPDLGPAPVSPSASSSRC